MHGRGQLATSKVKSARYGIIWRGSSGQMKGVKRGRIARWGQWKAGTIKILAQNFLLVTTPEKFKQSLTRIPWISLREANGKKIVL